MNRCCLKMNETAPFFGPVCRGGVSPPANGDGKPVPYTPNDLKFVPGLLLFFGGQKLLSVLVGGAEDELE